MTVGSLKARIEAALPGSIVDVDEPDNPKGSWFFDVRLWDRGWIIEYGTWGGVLWVLRGFWYGVWRGSGRGLRGRGCFDRAIGALAVSPILCVTVPDYLEATRKQVALHGIDKLRARDFVDYLSWDLRVGFESPDGWWTLRVRTIRGHYSRGDFKPEPSLIPGVVRMSRGSDDEVVRRFREDLREATADRHVSQDEVIH